MKEIVLPAIFASAMCIFERNLSFEKKPYTNYVMWFFVIVSCMCCSKAWGQEHYSPIGYYKVSAPVYTGDECASFYYDDEEPCWRGGAILPGIDKEAKFIPKGLPHDHIDENGLPTQKAIDLIKRTNAKMAHHGLAHHSQCAENARHRLEELCAYCPNIPWVERCKIAFSTAIAMVPGPASVKFTVAFLSVAQSIGVCYIQEWFDISEQNSLVKWHAAVADEYVKHIRSNRF